jgi:cell wall-associated NlpC family hydrolase
VSQGQPEVDTGIADLTTGTAIGMPGIDAPVMPDLSADMLPVATQGDFTSAWMNSSSPTNFAFEQNATGTRADVINYAKQFLGTPYVWGGTSPSGFDCSGFTQYVAKRFGVNIPRISQQQANAGEHTDLAHLQVGDLVLFPDDSSGGAQGPGHVALYMGNGQIIESPHTGATVRIRNIGKSENVFGVHLNYPGH